MLPEQYCYLSEITVSLFTRSQMIYDVLMRYFLTLDIIPISLATFFYEYGSFGHAHFHKILTLIIIRTATP